MASDVDPLEYIAAALRDPRVTPAQLRAFASDLVAAFGVWPSSSAAVSSWIEMWVASARPRVIEKEAEVVNLKQRLDGLTRFRPSTDPPPFPFARSPAQADTSMIATPEKILAVMRKADGAQPGVEKGPPQFQTVTAKSGASLADEILKAWRKANGEAEKDKDDPDDDDKEERGPNQRPLAVATAEGILAAMRKAEGR